MSKLVYDRFIDKYIDVDKIDPIAPPERYSEAIEVKGKWETVRANPSMMHCTNCLGTWWSKKFIEVFKYCPECGARMEGT